MKFSKAYTMMVEASEYRSIPKQIYDLIVHKLIINTHPVDYYLFEFYKQGKSWDEKSRFIGIRGSIYYPFENNLLKYNILFTDKYVQKLLYKGAGLPSPNLISTVGIDREISTQQQFTTFLSSIADDIVLKPISGAQGNKIFIVSRCGDEIYSNNNKCTPAEIWKDICTDIKRGFLIEERVLNRKQLADIFPTSLNTYRVVTIKTNDGKWHSPMTSLKVGTGNNVIDNIAAGGIFIMSDDDGLSTHAFDHANKPVTHHPDTGVNLTGIKLDGFHEATELGLQASRKFGFMGTFGWDIAITTKGPQIIEGNLCWGTSYPGVLKGMISEEIARGLKPRHMFSKWDKNYMYPNFYRKRKWPWIR